MQIWLKQGQEGISRCRCVWSRLPARGAFCLLDRPAAENESCNAPATDGCPPLRHTNHALAPSPYQRLLDVDLPIILLPRDGIVVVNLDEAWR